MLAEVSWVTGDEKFLKIIRVNRNGHGTKVEHFKDNYVFLSKM